jgi:glycerol-3-phosphate dehydrogenase (NAD+)
MQQTLPESIKAGSPEVNKMSKKVSIIGNGNWGTTIGRLLARNTAESNIFDSNVRMWGYPEKFDGRDLCSVINTDRVNPKYLPGVILPDNLTAVDDLLSLKDSDILVFALPHQFVASIDGLRGQLSQSCVGVTLTKGLIEVGDDDIELISSYLQRTLGISMSVLMGANIASEVAQDFIAEGTLAGCEEAGGTLYKLFNCQTYRVTKVKDIYGVELSGTLKNIVAMAYGFAEGLGCATNTRVAVFRNGLAEIKKFFKYFYPMASSDTLFQSSGVADLLVSCMSGRNFKCAKEMAEKKMTLREVEETMTNTKLQGPGTAMVVHRYLKRLKRAEDFKLFSTVYKICFEGESYDAILSCISPESLLEC